jgi:hypothetical protein
VKSVIFVDNWLGGFAKRGRGDFGGDVGRLDRGHGEHSGLEAKLVAAASRLSSDTNRCGPAWISTWAITVSLTTRVTRPVNRLRIDWAATGAFRTAVVAPSARSRGGRGGVRQRAALRLSRGFWPGW